MQRESDCCQARTSRALQCDTPSMCQSAWHWQMCTHSRLPHSSAPACIALEVRGPSCCPRGGRTLGVLLRRTLFTGRSKSAACAAFCQLPCSNAHCSAWDPRSTALLASVQCLGAAGGACLASHARPSVACHTAIARLSGLWQRITCCRDPRLLGLHCVATLRRCRSCETGSFSATLCVKHG